jgi:sulfate adenylyltransferase subunit 1 (EFTu-like GTPase family)
MDLINYNREHFEGIKQQYLDLTRTLPYNQIDFIPISALQGDNLFYSGMNMPWYQGETLMQMFENAQPAKMELEELRFSVQHVIQGYDKYGYLGNVISGKLVVGDTIAIQPGNKISQIESILDGMETILSAEAGQQICLFLKEPIILKRGAMLTSTNPSIKNSYSLEVTICWLNAKSRLKVGQEFYLRMHAIETVCTITKIIQKIDTDNFQPLNETNWVEENEFAILNIEFQHEIAWDHFRICSVTGRGILIDKITNYTSGVFVVNDEFAF